MELYSEEGFTFRTALHEVGHALGFQHTHCTTAFTELFVWPPAPDVKEDIYKAYDSLSRERVNLNLFEVDAFDTASFDSSSIMTYGLPANWLTARDGASQQAKSIADRSGISKNVCLSETDRRALVNAYGPARPIYRLSADLSATIFDDEVVFDEKATSGVSSFWVYVAPQSEEYLYTHLNTYKFGGELRLEVRLGAKAMTDKGLEMVVNLKLFEGTHVDTRDLDGEKTYTFTLPRDYASRSYQVQVNGSGDWGRINLELAFEKSGAAPSAIVDRPLLSDVNGDGQVDAADLVLVSNYLGQAASTSLPVDVNGDGIVTIADLVLVAQYLGQSTSASLSDSSYLSAPFLWLSLWDFDIAQLLGG